MSGSTIGGIAGGIIGFFVGGPAGAQWGFMIGSAVGAIVDPEKIEGPRLKDASNQTANDGIPRAYGYGRFPCTGNVIWRDVVKEVKNTEGGKGGPEVTTYTYTRSYAIAACKGPISGFLIIKRNGKIVYDTRPDSELTALGYTSQQISETRAAQAKFMEVATLYYGDQTSPDPTMVAVKGAGNVPNYTGTAFIVLTDDETREGEIAQYEFVVADCGERTDDFTPPAILLVAGDKIVDDGPVMAIADATATPVFTGIPVASGADVELAVPAAAHGIIHAIGADGSRYTTDRGVTWLTGSAPFPRPPRSLEGGPGGWALVDSLFGGGDTPARCYDIDPTSYVGGDIVGTGSVYFVKHTAGYWWTDTQGHLYRADTLAQSIWQDIAGAYQDNIYAYVDVEAHAGSLFAIVHIGLTRDFDQIRRSDDGGATFPHVVLSVPNTDIHLRPRYLQSNGEHLIAITENSAYAWTSADGYSEPHETGLANLTQSVVGRTIRATAERFFFLGRNPDTLNQAALAISEDGIDFGPIVSIPLVSATGMALLDQSAGSTLVPIPDSPGFYIDSRTSEIVGPPGTSIDSCTPTLGSIVAAQCAKRNVTAVDVSELTDPVTGYRVASVTSPQQNIAGLMPAFFFDSSQFDGTIHFPKRGGEPTFHIPYSELVERTDGTGIPLQWVRKQEPELLRKQTVGYIDPATTFTATTQQWERRAGTVKAQGESTLEIPVVGQADWAAQVAEKSGKVAWAESTEGSFHLTRAWAKLVTAAVGTIEDVDGSIHIIRIERIQDDGGIRMLDVRKTRASAYESTAEGAQKPLPLFPGSNIRGPTFHAVMNMPAALDQYDRPGVTWAAAGMTDGWVGARLQVLRAGEWVTLGDINTPGSVGTLASDLAAHSGDIDTANVLRIRMDDPLSSVTFTQLLNERNPVAILRDDHTVEVVQFQDAVQDSDGVWNCTTLIRGNLDTETTSHVSGATVVAMEGGIQFVDLRPDDLGKTLTFRVVSLGTDPDAAPTFSITFNYIWSSTEWPVAYLEVEKDGDDFNLSWIERRRLGTDATPIRSANWDGYAVSYEHAGGSGEVTVTDPAHTFTLPGATDVDFTVAQINRLTGRGPETTVNHE